MNVTNPAVTDGVTDNVMDEILTSDGCDGCDVLNENLVPDEEKKIDGSNVENIINGESINSEDDASHPSQELAQTIGSDELQPIDNPSQHPSQHPSQPITVSVTKDSPLEIFESCPPSYSLDTRAKRENAFSSAAPKATAIKDAMLNCFEAGELKKLRIDSGYSQEQIDWVYRNVLTPKEKAQVKQSANIKQLSLFDQPFLAEK